MKLLSIFLFLLTISVAAPVATPLAHADTKSDAEAGYILTGGNTKTSTLSLKDQTRYEWLKNVLQFNANFLQAKQDGTLSAKNWNLGLRYEREIHSLLSAFAAQNVEADRFSGIRQRYNSDLGAKYYIRKLEKDFTFFVEAGYRFTKENDTNGLTQDNEKARLYAEAEKFWTVATSTKLWVEYLPNFTVAEGWQLNSEASLSAALNSVFAVKMAYLLRYNNLPPIAAGKSDTSYTTSLVAKF